MNLPTWIDTVTKLVIAQVPLQSVDTAIVLVEAYLSDIGGWVPDNMADPNGDGHPNGDPTPQESADAIEASEFGAVYDLSVPVTVDLTLQISAKLSEGLSIESVAAAMENQIIDFVTDQINNSNLPLRVESVNPNAPTEARSDLGGNTTQTIRQTIATDLTGVDKVVDFKAIALLYVRNTYGLDNNWNVISFYTEPNQPIVIQIQKYTDTSYATLDTGVLTIYVISISPDTYNVVSGVILN